MKGVVECSDSETGTTWEFLDGVLSRVIDSFSMSGLDTIHDLLVKKYGPPTHTDQMVYKNDTGLVLPYKIWTWKHAGHTIICNELHHIGFMDIPEGVLYVEDDQLYNAYESRVEPAEPTPSV